VHVFAIVFVHLHPSYNLGCFLHAILFCIFLEGLSNLTVNTEGGVNQTMPYNKNKQQAFQAAQQGVEDARELYSEIVNDSASYGHQLQYLKQEVNEAYQQIENALEVASEHQRAQLEQFQQDLQKIVQEVNNYE
jgi:hypothetical protein